MAKYPTIAIMNMIREEHHLARIDGDEYCAECGSWTGQCCVRNPQNIIERPELMPGCRYFIARSTHSEV